ncbi:YncE family protein [Pedobacter nototheniae]|uniref:YncE family protein n=1 Tax=Pedobacter nototheniae TaxID=2488994 RepID=UPI0029316F37|nr:YncE family protein [Pedobacter nototheniae]
MKNKILSIVVLSALSFSVFAQQKSGLRILGVHKINSDGGWDYLNVDQKNKNIFISHGNQVNILNSKGDSVGIIANTPGVHGITFANTLNKGYTSNGKDASCTIFNLKTFAVLGHIAVGQNPDASFYDDFSGKVIVFNGKSKDASIINPQNDQVIATVPLGGKPEAGVSDGKGKIYVNIEDTNEIVCFDAVNFKILARYNLPGGEEPSGLAIDRLTSRLFTVCSNKKMLILDAKSGKLITSLPIGEECDGVVFDPATQTAYSANGEGNITVVKEISADKFVVQETIKTATGARTIAMDYNLHRLFLPTADLEKATISGQRPKRIPGTFRILELGK